MIVYDLQCEHGDRFEAWFASIGDYHAQCAKSLVECPRCGSRTVAKAPMAPNVPRKGASPSMIDRLAAAQAQMLKDSRWVGRDFADTARAMHAGEVEPAIVHGEATMDEARSLAEEGVPVAPLPLPVVPPNQVN